MRIKQLGEPILRQISTSVTDTEINSPEILQTIEAMKSILNGIQAISGENGNAIAAPQVGCAKRLIVLRLEKQFVTLINPKIVWVSEDTFDSYEECFSFYNLRGIVQRHRQATVEYTDEDNVTQSISLSGNDSALVQHEIDHLEGIFFLDRVSDITTVSSVESVYANDPAQLTKVREMISYMVGAH